MERKLILTGPLKGATKVLNGHKFVQGECVIKGQASGVESATRYLGRMYQAYPEGSKELKAAQERDAKRSGGNGKGRQPQ